MAKGWKSRKSTPWELCRGMWRRARRESRARLAPSVMVLTSEMEHVGVCGWPTQSSCFLGSSFGLLQICSFWCLMKSKDFISQYLCDLFSVACTDTSPFQTVQVVPLLNMGKALLKPAGVLWMGQHITRPLLVFGKMLELYTQLVLVLPINEVTARP